MEIGTLHSKFAEVNGKEPKSLRYRCANYLIDSKKSRARKLSLLGSQSLSMGVFSDDFATVDVREELCYHSRPEKANSRG